MNGADEDYIIYMFKPKDFKTIYPFDLNKFLTELHNYIFSEHDAENEYFCKDVNSNVKFGLEAFDIFLQFMNQTEGKERTIGYRCIHFIWEHKKGIYKRLEYIIQEYHFTDRLGEWLNKYQAVVELTQKARILFLESAMSKGGLYYIEKIRDKDTIENLTKILRKARDEESRILLAVYYILKYECLSKPQTLSQKNISDCASIRTSYNSGEPRSPERIWIELAWETQRTINRIYIMDSENRGGWRRLGRLIFSDGSFIHISDSDKHYGSTKEIEFEPKKVKFIRLEIFGNNNTFMKLPEVQVFEI